MEEKNLDGLGEYPEVKKAMDEQIKTSTKKCKDYSEEEPKVK